MMPLLITGDCRSALDAFAPFDMLIVDPPYGDTSLAWDRRMGGVFDLIAALLKPDGSAWVFGSMRYFIDHGPQIAAAGLRYAQDIVWEKHNGSGFHADRFKRVHEHIVQVYHAATKWADVFNEVQTTPDAVARAVHRNKRRPNHFGAINTADYRSEDGGPRIMRSVVYARSCHGRAIHPTEKPVDLLEILIRTSCPHGGTVGDPFAGSGAAGEASANAGRNYVGSEIDAEIADKARVRLASKLPLVAA